PEIVERSAAGEWAYSAIGQHAPLVLTKARHPLLDQRSVVPTDLWLGGEFRLLLITGPNTGGKTVALKTTGLLALMAQAGMHIPAAEPSRLPVFGQVFADIGDEQSIEQSLSTFSSHMTNIIRILRAIDDTPAEAPPMAATEAPVLAPAAEAEPPARRLTLREEEELERLSNWRKVEPGAWAPIDAITPDPLPSLVLLDELGAGTDPVEGAALARSIIERLLARDVMGVATTHYAELKAFAYATDGVVNGSVEFDIETLQPTYRLTIGLPGRSNALAIAERLGLAADLVARARSTMANDDAQVEDLLAGIHAERIASADELRRAGFLRAEAEQERDRLRAERREFEVQREAEWQAARAAIETEFADVRNQLRRLRDDFRTVTVSRQWMEEAERRLQEAKEQSTRMAPPTPPTPA
ncbi:MAG TPA: hypothetical protein PKA05_12640, partial [Roseiflexaceae bacterium]|nr:hypothetical protein [Roseiflexaceae bacterium]